MSLYLKQSSLHTMIYRTYAGGTNCIKWIMLNVITVCNCTKILPDMHNVKLRVVTVKM